MNRESEVEPPAPPDNVVTVTAPDQLDDVRLEVDDVTAGSSEEQGTSERTTRKLRRERTEEKTDSGTAKKRKKTLKAEKQEDLKRQQDREQERNKILREMPEHKRKYFELYDIDAVGREKFVVIHAKGEAIMYENDKKFVKHVENEDEFNQVKGNLKHIYLIRRGVVAESKATATGLYVDKNLDMEKIAQLLLPIRRKSFEVVNSRTQIISRMVLDTFWDKFPQDNSTLNILGLEFSYLDVPGVHEKFELPSIVLSENMTFKLRDFLNNQLEIVEKQLNGRLKKADRKTISAKKANLELQRMHIRPYEKFCIVSNGGSFSDVHVDMGGTAVYYHVIEGAKHFYVAKSTKENMAAYSRWETSTEKYKVWIGLTLWDQWQRLVIEKGNTAIIPPGYIHFVYTPVDSLVIGGNFLMEQFIDDHFTFANLDSIALSNGRITIGNCYQQFDNIMWSYAKNIFLPEMQSNVDNDDLSKKQITIARSFVKNLMKKLAVKVIKKRNKEVEDVTFLSREEKEQVLRDLVKLLEQATKEGNEDVQKLNELKIEVGKRIDENAANGGKLIEMKDQVE